MKNKDKLYHLIVNNENLEKLEVKLNKFNPFKILNIGNHEIKHSNVLGWLLDPKDNHNLGDKILKKIISEIIIRNEEIVPDNINVQQIQLQDFNDSIVLRENNNIDILVVSKKNKFVLLVENKIYAQESKHQLKKYLNITEENYPNYKILPVFLTVSGVEPKGEKRYCVFDHESIYNIVNFTTDLYKNYMPIEVFHFIKFYLTTLKEIINMDQETIKLCKDIYNEHKEALETIFQVINMDDSEFLNACKEFIDSHDKELFITGKSNKWFCFFFDEFKHIPKTGSNWNSGFPIVFWFTRYDDSLKIALEVGPFTKPENRIKLLEHLQQNGFKVNQRAKKIESQYSRIYTTTKPIKDWTDKEELIRGMEYLFYTKCKEISEKIFNALQNYNWD